MEGNENLDMSLFNGDVNLELNLGGAPDDVAEFLQGEEDPIETPPVVEGAEGQEGQEEPIVPPADDIIIDLPDEGASPEDVVGDEGSEDGSGDGASTSPNLYSSFASELHKEGLLPSVNLDDIKVESTEDLGNLIKAQIDSQTKEYLINKLGEEGYDAIEKGVSLADYQAYQQNIQNLDQVTDEVIETNIDLAKRVILQDYINQGLTEAKANRILQKTIDLGEESVIEDAKESVKSLRVFEANRLEQVKTERQEQIKAQQKEQEKIDNDLKNAIYNQKEIINGMPLNKTVQDRVYKAITNVVSESPTGVPENALMKHRRENPIEFDTKLYYLYEITNGFSDFSKVTKAATSKATSDFEKVLRQQKFAEGSGAPTFMQDPESYGGIGSEIVL